jgi:hypothetical protein
MSQNSPKQWFQLEEVFFRQVDETLLQKLRSEMETAKTAEAIMRVTGIADEALATEMASIHVTVDTLAAFRLVPLVAVAWADDRVESDERDVILKLAEQSGIEKGDPAMDLLESWTKQKPGNELLEAWCEYAGALSNALGAASRERLKEEVVRNAKKVAEACGGVFGFASVSPNEQATMDKIERAFA